MRACLFLFASIVVLVPAQASAYRTVSDHLQLSPAQKVAWQRLPIDLDLYAQAEDPIDAMAVSDALDVALALWDETACAQHTIELTGNAADPAASMDGRNTVQWVHEGWSDYGDADALAATEVGFVAVSGRYALIEADIFLNAETIEWDEARLARLDGVLAHEIGHALGLVHPCEENGEDGAPRCDDEAMTLMHPFYNPAQLELASDDAEGVCFLYPNGASSAAAVSEPSGCAVRPRPAGAPGAFAALLVALAIARAQRRRATSAPARDT